MSIDEAKDLILFCRENGVSQIVFDGLQAVIDAPMPTDGVGVKDPFEEK